MFYIDDDFIALPKFVLFLLLSFSDFLFFCFSFTFFSLWPFWHPTLSSPTPTQCRASVANTIIASEAFRCPTHTHSSFVSMNNARDETIFDLNFVWLCKFWTLQRNVKLLPNSKFHSAVRSHTHTGQHSRTNIVSNKERGKVSYFRHWPCRSGSFCAILDIDSSWEWFDSIYSGTSNIRLIYVANWIQLILD